MEDWALDSVGYMVGAGSGASMQLWKEEEEEHCLLVSLSLE